MNQPPLKTAVGGAHQPAGVAEEGRPLSSPGWVTGNRALQGLEALEEPPEAPRAHTPGTSTTERGPGAQHPSCALLC